MGATVTDPLVGRMVGGRYEVVSRIARGGMATVYLAIDRRLDREVALKVMHPHLAEGDSGGAFVARFRREARSAARLTHPGLVAVFDQGVDGGTSYLTMEYVAGTNLRRRISEEGSLTLHEALRVTESVLDALAVAHRTGLVHRDVKPENVLIGEDDDRVRVADFGLARAVTEMTATSTGTVLGTVAYLAPELVQHGTADTRTDVYAVGVMLFEMLTGRQPFTGETPIQVALQHVTTQVPPPSTRVEWLPSEVDELVAALAAHDPADRPVDAAAALHLLRRTRAALDEVVLDRRADVPPAQDPPTADEDLLDGDLLDDDQATDGDATTHVPVGAHARGGTVALPIGLGTSPTAEPAARHRRLPLLLALVGVLVLAGLGAWWFVAAGPGAYTQVPDVVAVAEEEAVAALEAAGLDHTRSEAFDDEAPAGTVVSTEPGPGDRVRKDGTVTYVVSKGPDLVVVPGDVVGAMQADAARALEAADLEVRYGTPEHHDEAPKGSVLTARLPDGSDAEAGTEVRRGSMVTLVLSDGPAPVTVTSVVNISVEAAQEQLAPDALTVETVEAFHDTVPAGRIIEQSPAAGETAHRGDVVTVTVSKGPEPVVVPNVVQVDYEKAKAQLEEAGFKVERKNSWGGLIGRVVDQSVPGGQTAPKGSTITLTVV